MKSTTRHACFCAPGTHHLLMPFQYETFLLHQSTSNQDQFQFDQFNLLKFAVFLDYIVRPHIVAVVGRNAKSVSAGIGDKENAILFALVSAPATYKLSQAVLGKIVKMAEPNGCPTMMGLLGHGLAYGFWQNALSNILYSGLNL